MIRRPLLPAAALVATLTLAACNSSPEAGRPNTTPTRTPTSATPTASPTPKYTAEEEAAITAAKSRYVAAREAVGAALREPDKATRAGLEKAGNGGQWVTAVAGQIHFQQQNGWYQTGEAKILSTAVQTVNLEAEQPEVRLVSCVDSSKLVTRYKSSGKPIPAEADNGPRHKFQSKLVFAPPAGAKTKMWFLVEEKVTGPC